VSAQYLFTYSDVIERLEYFARGLGVGADQTLRREAIRAAYRQIPQERNWSFLHSNARLVMHAPQTTGTVSFDLTGGLYERMLTLTGATWPTWTQDASVRLGDPPIVCDVDECKTSTIITLDRTMCPVEDITSTTYTLYPRWYALPNDFLSLAHPMDEDTWTLGLPLSKEEIEQLNRFEDTTGSIEFYAIGSPLDLYGRMALYRHPPADDDETLDIPYIRRPRDIVWTGYDLSLDAKGTITVTEGFTTVTGSGTAFESGMIGSILRIGTSSSARPSGLSGTERYGEQQSIKSVASTTNMTLSAAVATSRVGVMYRITDPIDLDIAVYDAFVRRCELELSMLMKDRAAIDVAMTAYASALRSAKQGDFRIYQPQVAGLPRKPVGRLADSPLSRRTVVE